MQVHTININPETGEMKILLVGVKDPVVTTLTPTALQAVLEGAAEGMLQTLLPGYQAAPRAAQPVPQATQRRRVEPPRRSEPIEDPDDDPILEESTIDDLVQEVDSCLRGLFDPDYEIEVHQTVTGQGPQITATWTAPSGLGKGAVLTWEQYLADDRSIRPFVSDLTGRSL